MANHFEKHYSEESLTDKLRKYARTAGAKVVYAVLLLYYVMMEPGTPVRTRITIAAALGYFIFPLDAIVDITPLIGYSDDLGVLIFALMQVASSVTSEVKSKARKHLEKWFPSVEENEIADIDERFKMN